MEVLMAQLSVCIEMLFKEYPFLERIDMTARAGLPAVEFWDWHEKDIAAIKKRARAAGVQVAAFTGNMAALTTETQYSPLVPERRHEFLDQIRRAVEIANDLECRTVIALAGNTRPAIPREEQRAALVESLRRAAVIAAEGNVTLALEPLNTTVNHEGYFLDKPSEGWQILTEVDSEHVKMLYDLYHVQIMEGNLIAGLEPHLHQLGHVHIGDVPGRYEPGTGEINYRNVLKWIHDSGYGGYMGLEYRVTGDTWSSLERVQEVLGLGSDWQFA
jgi:hydroxypyruvate isomerase